MEPPRTPLRTVVPWLVVMLTLGALAVVVGLVRLDSLPDPYPVHFGPAGDPDRFTPRSPGAVLAPVAVGQLLGLVLIVITGVLPGTGPSVRHALAALGCVTGGGISLISLSQYLSDDAVPPSWTFWLLLAAILATTVWLVVVSVRSSPATEEDSDGWRLGGLVYSDPDDPTVFVPKRVGTGVTINFGRPLGWLVMGLLLLPGVIIVIGVTLMT